MATYLNNIHHDQKKHIMHITSDINTAIVVAARFQEQRQNAETAENALRKFYMNAGNWMITDDERKVLQTAVGILQTVIGKTGQHDIEKYLRDHQPVQSEQPAGV